MGVLPSNATALVKRHVSGGDKNYQMAIEKKFSGVRWVTRSVHFVVKHVPHRFTDPSPRLSRHPLKTLKKIIAGDNESRESVVDLKNISL